MNKPTTLIMVAAAFLSLHSYSEGAQSVSFTGAQTTTVGSGLFGPWGVAVDGMGNVFIGDGNHNRVVKVPAGGGAQTTVGSGLSGPWGVAVDGTGDVFIADSNNNRVVKVPAGGGAQTTVGAGLSGPTGVAVDGAGNVFISDTGNNRVVKVPAGGGAQTTVGSGLVHPTAVAVDGAGDVFIAEPARNTVVEVAAGGTQTTLGSGLNQPFGVAADGAGDVFILDSGNARVVEVPAGGTQTTVPTSGLNGPEGVGLDGAGDIFIADSGNNRVVEVQRVAVNFAGVNIRSSTTLMLNYSVNTTTTFASNPTVVTQGAPSLDFTLSSNTCTGTITAPGSCTVTAQFAPRAPGLRMGAVQLLDSTSTLLATTLIYGIGQGPATAFSPSAQSTLNVSVGGSGLNLPEGVAVDAAGDVFIADTGNNRVVEVPTGGGAQTTVGAGLSGPSGVALDGAGDVFIGDNGNNRVVEVPAGGGAQFTVGSGLSFPFAVAVDGAGDVFIADDGNNRVVEVPAGGGAQTTLGSGLNLPSGVAVDGTRDVFIGDTGNSRVVEVPAGGGAQFTVGSGLLTPYGVAVDGADDVFIADYGNNRVVEVPAGGGAQTTLGSGLSSPIGVAVDGAGDVFIADTGNNRVVEIQGSVAPSFSFASTVVGSTSTDSPQDVTVQNIGNLSLDAVALGLSFGVTSFEQAPGPGTPPDCTTTFSLAPGASCNLSVSFTPKTASSFVSDATFTDNALNAAAATQNISLSGTGTPANVTLTTTASTAVTLGTTSPTLSDSAVLAGGDNPSGTITFTLTGPGGFSYSQTDTVSGNGTYTASTTLPSTGSVAGTYTWTVMYVGDPNNNAANDQGGVAEQTTVSAASPAIITTPNPTSVAPGIGSQVLKDTATLLGGFHATGTITFTLFSPGGAVPVDTETVTVNGNGTYSTPTGFTLPSSGAVAGTYQWDAAYTGDSNNNSVSENNNTNEQVVVNQASTLTQLHSSSNPGVYGHYVLFTAKVSSGGYALPAGAGTVTFTDTTTSTTLATAVPLNSSGHASVSLRTLTPGSHMISATYNPDSNHTTSFGTESFSVNQAPLTITASSSSMNYGGTPPAVTPFYSGFTYGDTAAVLTTPATCTTTATSSTPAGTDTGANTCSGAASGNYNISYVPGNVTVRKAVLGITASSTSMSYGGTPPAVTPLYSAFAGSDTAASLTTAPTCTTTATSSTPLGWDLGANTCSGAVDDNYNFIYRAGNMHVGKASLTITASSTSMSYGGTPPAVTPLYSAFAGSDTVASLTTPPTCKTTATSSTRAGTDTGANTCSGAVDSNYTITYVPGNVAIGMASLTITADSTSMTYGQTPPTVTPLYSGFVAGNVAGNLTTRPTCTTTATSSTPVGTLTAANTCAGAVDGNYNIAYVAGNMTVNQSNSTAAVTSSQNPSAFGQPVTFTATVSEAAPGTGTPTGSVTFLDTGSPLGTATLSGGVATLTTSALAVGSHTIGYSYSGDTNFNSRTGSMSGNPQVVTKASTLAQLHSSSNPGVYGHYVLFTATVSAGGYALPAGAGTVTFIDTATSQTLATAVPLNSSGHASVNIRTLSAGIAHIIQATYNPDSNHLTSSATESFSVNRAPLTIQASSTSMKFGGTPPAVTPIYFGFTYGDTAAVLTTLPTCTTTATSSTPVGTDTGANTCSGAVDVNFNFTYVPGNVTVTAR